MVIGIPCELPAFILIACVSEAQAHFAPATGSAGLINTISSFASSHILAGVFGVLASAGWILQAAGGSILYKRVRHAFQ